MQSPNDGMVREKLFEERSKYSKVLQLEMGMSPMALLLFIDKLLSFSQPLMTMEATEVIRLKERSRFSKLLSLNNFPDVVESESTIEFLERLRDLMAGHEVVKAERSESEAERALFDRSRVLREEPHERKVEEMGPVRLVLLR